MTITTCSPTDGVVVGRIMKAAASPEGSPWLWTLAFGHHEDRTPTHGYAATREIVSVTALSGQALEKASARKIRATKHGSQRRDRWQQVQGGEQP
jgi:hypothetical protein